MAVTCARKSFIKFFPYNKLFRSCLVPVLPLVKSRRLSKLVLVALESQAEAILTGLYHRGDTTLWRSGSRMGRHCPFHQQLLSVVYPWVRWRVPTFDCSRLWPHPNGLRPAPGHAETTWSRFEIDFWHWIRRPIRALCYVLISPFRSHA